MRKFFIVLAVVAMSLGLFTVPSYAEHQSYVTSRCKDYPRWPGAVVGKVCVTVRYRARHNDTFRITKIRSFIQHPSAFTPGTAVWCEEISARRRANEYLWIRSGRQCNINRAERDRVWFPEGLIVRGREGTVVMRYEPSLRHWPNPTDEFLVVPLRIPGIG